MPSGRPKGSKNKLALPKKKDKERVLEALQKTHGILDPAIKPLNIRRSTVHKWVNEDPDFAEKYFEIREATLDLVETKLIEAANKGNVQALIFMARSLLQSRGYKTTDTEVTVNNNTVVFQIGTGDIGELPPTDPRIQISDNNDNNS